MRYEVLITDTAKQDIREIAFWIMEQSKDVLIAKKSVSELRKKCETPDTLPDGGALPKDRVLLSAGYRFIM